MSAYSTIVVGTDGSASAMKAVEKAARLAGDEGATLVIACAYQGNERNLAAEDLLGDEAFQIRGSGPTDAVLQAAADRAVELGAQNISRRPIMGQPVEALIGLAGEVEADLLVVGNRGLRGIGRLLGSVSADVSRKSPVDVLIVHTT
ncbi:MAG: universal stress protein [Nocardiaceae bacterium]|nr:universal stress protein [Nocardiaceae bacterium]